MIMMKKHPHSEKSSAILGVGFLVILRGIGVGIRENPGVVRVPHRHPAVLVGSLPPSPPLTPPFPPLPRALRNSKKSSLRGCLYLSYQVGHGRARPARHTTMCPRPSLRARGGGNEGTSSKRNCSKNRRNSGKKFYLRWTDTAPLDVFMHNRC